MSADNTIAILVTRRRDGMPGHEHRVACVMVLENLWEDPDYPSSVNPVLNREVVRRFFGSCPVHFSLEEAKRAAAKLENEYPIVEYGIKVLNYSEIFFPASYRKRNRRNRFRRFSAQS